MLNGLTMNKIKLLTFSTIALALINVGLLVFLLVKKPPRHNGHDDLKKVIINQMHFDDSQQIAYHKLVDKHGIAMEDFNDGLKIQKNVLYELLKKSDYSVERDSIINNIATITKSIDSLHFSHFEDIKKLCTTDQMGYFNDFTTEVGAYFNPAKRKPRQ